MAAPRLVSVASYNIHRGFGADGRYRPDRIAAVIEELAVDVLGLQEVDWRHHREDEEPQCEYFSAASGMTAIAGPNIRGRRSRYGNLLLTRFPVLAVRRWDLSVRRFEPRGAIAADLNVGGAVLRVVVTHLGRRARERRKQVERLLSEIGHVGNPATVLLGDWNDWLPASPTLRPMFCLFGPETAPRTYPSWRPLLSLDRVYMAPPEGLRSVAAHATKTARVASDHLPVKALLDPNIAGSPRAGERETGRRSSHGSPGP